MFEKIVETIVKERFDMQNLKFLKGQIPIYIAPYYDGTNASIIGTKEKIYYSDLLAKDVLRELCLMYGCTYDGRRRATQKMLGITRKPPILISELHQLVALELPYERVYGNYEPDYMYLFQLDFEVESLDNQTCSIHLDNNTSFIIPLSKPTVKYKKSLATEILYTFAIESQFGNKNFIHL